MPLGGGEVLGVDGETDLRLPCGVKLRCGHSMCPDPYPEYTLGLCLGGRPEGSGSLARLGFCPKLGQRKEVSPWPDH